MKRIFAVALFLMLFASAAFADGGGIWPPQAATQPPLVSVAA